MRLKSKPKHQQDLEFRLQTISKWERSSRGFITRHAAFEGLGYAERKLIKREQEAMATLVAVQTERLALMTKRVPGASR